MESNKETKDIETKEAQGEAKEKQIFHDPVTGEVISKT
jgi:hypothetical protein